jgi:hypothetical protein
VLPAVIKATASAAAIVAKSFTAAFADVENKKEDAAIVEIMKTRVDFFILDSPDCFRSKRKTSRG